MSSIIIKQVSDGISIKLNQILNDLDKLPSDGHKELVRTTPIKTGNAKNKTKMMSKTQIKGDYPYADRLDNGWSKQAPNGMTKPFEKWIDKEISNILRK